MSESKRKNGTFIHGVAASEHLDSSGERIMIEGVDISSLTKDGVLNMEHQSKEASSIVGKIWEAKKILKQSDCDNDHHRFFWDKVKMPYIYIAGELFDAVGHKEASEVAAMLKFDQQESLNKESKKLINFSIEGSRVEKQGSVITKCIARKVSITLTPCNKVCEAHELKIDDREEKHSDSGKFSFIQDIMSKSDEPSCQIMKGENPFLYKNDGMIASPKPTKPKTTIARPDKGFGAVVDKTPKPPAKPNYGKVIIKAKDTPVVMTAEDAVKEHKRVVDVLESPSHKDDKKEAKKQKKELKEYKESLDKNEKKVVSKDPALDPTMPEKPASASYEQKAKAWLASKQKPKKLSKYDSNVRKALTASCGTGVSAAAKVQGSAIAKSEPRKPLPRPKFFDNHKDLIPKDHPDHEKALDHINREHREGNKLEARRLHDRYISGGGSFIVKSENDIQKAAAPKIKQEKPKQLIKKPIKAKAAPAKVSEKTPVVKEPKEEKKPLTFRGTTVLPNKGIKNKTNATLDPEKGILSTPAGNFALHYPKHDDEDYQKILNSPDIQDIHTNAMKNWFKLNNLVRSGQKLPEELIAHGNAFSILSANTPVPSQELSYSRLVDTLKQRGVEMHSPKIAEEFARGGAGRNAWVASDSPTELPQHSREYWAGRANPAITQKESSLGTGRNKGDIVALGSTNAFSDRLSRYPEAHKYIADLVHGYGDDARSIVSLMMASKSNPKLPKDHPMKQGVGLGSKTSRYAMAMLGGGNVVIPDTHFVRHSFGLDANKDSDAITYLKSLLWDPKNFHLLNTLDEHYQQNHPAVKFVQNKYFGGKEDPNAIFPAFWLHWLSIAPHEKQIGIGKPYASKNLTDHTPFWDTAKEILAKHGLDGNIKKSENQSILAKKTAAAVHELEQTLGSAPSSMIYYAYILPYLLKGLGVNDNKMIRPPDAKNLMQNPTVARPAIKQAMAEKGNQAFNRFEKKEELVKFLENRLPNLSEKERLALAKAVAYVSEKKKESILESLLEEDDE